MSLSLLNIGMRGLAAAQGSLATTSHNIANASTAGYSRQGAVLASAGGLATGVGFFGGGVDITTVRRQYDQFLAGSLQALGSRSAADAARADGLSQVDALFADAEQGVGASIDRLFNAFGDVAMRPADLSARQVLLHSIDQLAQRFAGLGGQLDALRDQSNARLSYEAGQVNQYLTEVRQLNSQISAQQSGGHAPNDLLDQRDQALQALGAFIEVRTVAGDNGALHLFSASGAPLLVGQQQAVLSAKADPSDNRLLAISMAIGGTSQWMSESALGSGSMAGTLRFRDSDLASISAQLGRLAVATASQLNAQQALGVDATGAAGQPLVDLPTPGVRTNAANTGSGALDVSFASTQDLRASDYKVTWSGAAYSITRLADGQVTRGLTMPATLDGLRFASTGAANAGDSWMVQPYADAATGLRVAPLSASQIASGYAAMPQAALSNTGAARVAAFEVSRATADAVLPVSITFNDPPTSYTVSGVSGVPSTPTPYVAGQSIPAAPADYNGWRIVIDGLAAAGDRFDVQATSAPGADNRNALAFGRIASRALVEGATLNHGYASLVADTGGRVQSSRALATVSQRLQVEAQGRRENLSGVNLDEEAANLLRHQQAYQAAAKIIQTSQSLFDALLAATGR